MNTRQSLRLIAAAAAAANGGKTLHMNGNGSFEIEKGISFCHYVTCLIVKSQCVFGLFEVTVLSS